MWKIQQRLSVSVTHATAALSATPSVTTRATALETAPVNVDSMATEEIFVRPRSVQDTTSHVLDTANVILQLGSAVVQPVGSVLVVMSPSAIMTAAMPVPACNLLSQYVTALSVTLALTAETIVTMVTSSHQIRQNYLVSIVSVTLASLGLSVTRNVQRVGPVTTVHATVVLMGGGEITVRKPVVLVYTAMTALTTVAVSPGLPMLLVSYIL